MANEPLQFGPYYHIYNRGNNGNGLFAERRNYPYFLERYAVYIEPVAETYAYCLMPNHFHFAIRVRTEEEQEVYHEARRRARKIGPISEPFELQEPSRAFNNLFISYARAFNKATGRTGTLFERPFGRKAIDREGYLLTVVRYIHHNPQRHGFVGDFRD